MKFKQALVSRLLAQGTSVLNFFKVMGIETSGCEIIGFLKKLKDADPADSPPCETLSFWSGKSARRAGSRDSGADCCCGGHLHSQ